MGQKKEGGHGGVIRELEQCREQVQRQASSSSCSVEVRTAERARTQSHTAVPEEETTVAKWAQH